MPEVLMPSHLACIVIVAVGSLDVSQNFRQSKVLTQVCTIRFYYTGSNEFTFNLCTRFVYFQHTKHMKWHVRSCTELGYRIPLTKPNMP